MTISDLFKISFRQVMRQQRRSLGVFLAVAFGISGFITITTMSEEVKKSINQDLEFLGGATKIKVEFERPLTGYRANRPNYFHENTLAALRRLDKIKSVTQIARKLALSKVIIRDQVYHVIAFPVDGHFWEVNDLKPPKGRFFSNDEVQARKTVCVLGENLAQKLFKTENPIGQNLLCDGSYFRVVGILGGLAAREMTDYLIFPLTTAQDRLANLNPANIIYVRCQTWDDVEPMSKVIPAIVKANQDNDGLMITVPWAPLKQVKRTAYWIELFSYASVLGILVLGGFGIWNITKISIQARTREIGLKKAMGGEDKDIFAQFFTETLSLSLSAAIAGIIVGRALVELIALKLGSHPPESVFWNSVFQGGLISIGLGIVAGLYPSIKASRLEVIEAMRFE